PAVPPAPARCVSATPPARTPPSPPRPVPAWRAGHPAPPVAGGTGERRLRGQRVGDLQPATGPDAIATATARFSSTAGDGVTCASASYSATMRGQSVPRGYRSGRDTRRLRPAGRTGRVCRQAV